MTPPVRYFRTTRLGLAMCEWDGYFATASVPGGATGRGFHVDADRAILFAIRAMH